MSLYDLNVQTIDGKDVSLAQYKGKALLIVNTASQCGYTPQYKGLEELYQAYKAKGFEVLAFPSNDFGGQEPGTNAEVKQFCELKYKTTFPLFAKVAVKGDGAHPLYKYLQGLPKNGGEVNWNFNKFLVAADGTVVAHLPSKAEPMSDSVKQQVEAVLPKK
ncbi:MAG: glutathione peroxidase [Myxococcaceae bacterium]|nr:glutathione peroxidase [Myxococcaceae bacterium]